MKNEVIITSAKRTAVGSLNKTLRNIPAFELGAAVISSILQNSNTKKEEIDEIVLGQVLTGGLGQNPARQAAIKSGIPKEKPAYIVNQVCGSGIRSIVSAYQSIKLGESKISIAGGQENMSLAPHAIHLRDGKKLGDTELTDTMIKDGLWDAFHGYHMGITAENIAADYGISREDMDQFSAQSQARAAHAREAGYFKNQITPLELTTRRKTVTFDNDEFIRPETTTESLASLRAAFTKDGLVTAGNSSGINDGTASLVLANSAALKTHKVNPLARIIAYGFGGVPPRIMGMGPVPASEMALERSGLSVDDLDLVESNEAFAAQACAVSRQLNLDPARVNPNGGAIALGHPVGATGAIIMTKLIHELHRINGRYGMATMCIGGGQGISVVIDAKP